MRAVEGEACGGVAFCIVDDSCGGVMRVVVDSAPSPSPKMYVVLVFCDFCFGIILTTLFLACDAESECSVCSEI